MYLCKMIYVIFCIDVIGIHIISFLHYIITLITTKPVRLMTSYAMSESYVYLFMELSELAVAVFDGPATRTNGRLNNVHLQSRNCEHWRNQIIKWIL